jgi:hypothetical protein
MQRIYKTAFGLLTVLFAIACNPNSDALHILQNDNTSLKATIGFYEGLQPTMTAQATVALQKMATMQSDMKTLQAQNRDLIAKANSNTGGNAPQQVQPLPNTASNNNGQQPQANTTVGGNNASPAQTPTAFGFGRIVTSRGKNANGCAANETTSFTAADDSIWVIAEVFNYKRGTKFTAQWAGTGFTHDNDWTITSSGSQICIHFYIEPQTLALQSGNYTVTVSTADMPGTPVQFTYTAGDTTSSTSLPGNDTSAGANTSGTSVTPK